MSDLSYIDKLNIQLRENVTNVDVQNKHAKMQDVDTSYTMGQAIAHFIGVHDLNDIKDPELRNDFHDAMHITALAHDSTPRGEALAGVVEQTLLREPYNGDINQKLDASRNAQARVMHLIVGTRRFNPAGHEDFEKPAPVASLDSALALGQERLDFTSGLSNADANITEQEMIDAYHRAVEIDDFFKNMMGGRAVYQLSLKELSETPIAFFGIETIGEGESLDFVEIPKETRQEIIKNLGDQNTVLHHIEEAKTAADIHALGLEWPDPSAQHLEL